MIKQRQQKNEWLLTKIATQEKKEKWAKEKDITFEHLSNIINVILQLHKYISFQLMVS